MKIALINGSPKHADSASGILLTDIGTIFGETTETITIQMTHAHPKPEEQERIMACDGLIAAFPLYVDGIPAQFLSCLMDLERVLRGKEGIFKAAAIMNCGFFEGIQCETAMRIMKNWCTRSGLTWILGIGIGGGPMLSSVRNVPMGHGPKSSIGAALSELCTHMEQGMPGEDIYTNVNFPRLAYKLAAEWQWKSEAKKNGVKA